MIDCLSIVETDKVNHAVEIDIVKLLVEIESFGMSSDEFDKDTGSSDVLQPKRAESSCVHALNELHLHEIHVVPSTHEADQLTDTFVFLTYGDSIPPENLTVLYSLRCRTMHVATCTRMTPDAIEEMIERRMAEALEAYQNCEPIIENGDGHENDNGDDNGDGGGTSNGNGMGGGNGAGNPNVNVRGVVPVARECTYQDFVKCRLLNLKGTEGVVGLTRWFEKMEMIFHISNYPHKYQVKYASCTLQNGTLNWWNSHKRTVGTDAAYAMTWKVLMKLMIKVYCPRNEIQKMETEAYETPGCCPYCQQLDRLKTKGYATRNVENKRRFDNNLRDNRVQQPPFKRQNGNGHNVARAYNVGNSEKRGYAGPLPCCNKYRLHHEGQCTVKCGNYKRVGHTTKDCRDVGHYRSDCPKLKNQNCGNKSRNKPNEARERAYALGGGGANIESNVLTSTFLLNNHYARMLFDSGADRSFVSTTFSVLLDIIPSTLDVSYVVELANRRIAKMNTLLRGCTLVISYDEKVVRIPYGDEVLEIQGDECSGRDKSRLSIISCTKTQKYIQKGCQVLLAQDIEKKAEDKSEEKRHEDVPTV
ncbi:hypothetical protein Tco_0821469 [Tanacetum coccineum]|uniref:Reverse transcriptase domain-containing protein n=1 Tax=Tanacetum coccineum TaxID=301880 RepID=A0ABQ5ACC4_9ASTR